MINQSRLKIYRACDLPIASTVTTIAEGACLVQVFDVIDNVAKVQTSTGASGEVPVGGSYSQMMTPSTFPRYEQFNVPAATPYTITLQKTPISNTQIGVKRVSNNTLLTVDNGGSSPTTGHVALNGNVLTFNSADAGLQMDVIYRYNLTVVEARTIGGDGVLGASNPVIEAGSCGVIQNAQFYTDQYDPTVDWTVAGINDIKSGANGWFTRGGTGGAIVGYVIRSPQVDDPYLGIMMNQP